MPGAGGLSDLKADWRGNFPDTDALGRAATAAADPAEAAVPADPLFTAAHAAASGLTALGLFRSGEFFLVFTPFRVFGVEVT